MAWQICTLADPETGAVRYVGQTTYGGGRLGTHIAEARRSAGYGTAPSPKNAWILRLLARDLEPVVTVVDTYCKPPDDCTRKGIERQWIDAFHEAGADLLNVQHHPNIARPSASPRRFTRRGADGLSPAGASLRALRGGREARRTAQ